MMEKPTTIVLNGAWGRVFSGIVLAAVLAGASGLIVAFKMSWALEAQADQITDHEDRIRTLEDNLQDVNTGIQVLLERTDPGKR